MITLACLLILLLGIIFVAVTFIGGFLVMLIDPIIAIIIVILIIKIIKKIIQRN